MNNTNNIITHLGYSASVSVDAIDKIIVGRVLGIDDIIVFHGKSIAECEKNFHAVVKDYIAACAELGAEPEKPASGKLMLRIAPEAHAAALRAARSSGISLNKWAEKVLVNAAR